MYLPSYPNLSGFHFLFQIFAQSLNLAGSGMLGMNFGRFIIDRINLGVGFFLFALGFIFW